MYFVYKILYISSFKKIAVIRIKVVYNTYVAYLSGLIKGR